MMAGDTGSGAPAAGVGPREEEIPAASVAAVVISAAAALRETGSRGNRSLKLAAEEMDE